ncbi:MAG: hypothetical protein AAGB04_32455 [Pseudomonadota bacterium]
MNASDPELTLSNMCGLEKNVFLVALYTNKVPLPAEESIELSHEEFMERLNTETEEIDKLVGEAFSKVGEREERFKVRAERFMGGHNSEDCVYLKLRIAEILSSN